MLRFSGFLQPLGGSFSACLLVRFFTQPGSTGVFRGSGPDPSSELFKLSRVAWLLLPPVCRCLPALWLQLDLPPPPQGPRPQRVSSSPSFPDPHPHCPALCLPSSLSANKTPRFTLIPKPETGEPSLAPLPPSPCISERSPSPGTPRLSGLCPFSACCPPPPDGLCVKP